MFLKIIGINIINLRKESNFMHYDKFKKNVYSQNGEDGVLQQLIIELNLNVIDMWMVNVKMIEQIKAYLK